MAAASQGCGSAHQFSPVSGLMTVRPRMQQVTASSLCCESLQLGMSAPFTKQSKRDDPFDCDLSMLSSKQGPLPHGDIYDLWDPKLLEAARLSKPRHESGLVTTATMMNMTKKATSLESRAGDLLCLGFSMAFLERRINAGFLRF